MTLEQYKNNLITYLQFGLKITHTEMKENEKAEKNYKKQKRLDKALPHFVKAQENKAIVGALSALIDDIKNGSIEKIKGV